MLWISSIIRLIYVFTNHCLANWHTKAEFHLSCHVGSKHGTISDQIHVGFAVLDASRKASPWADCVSYNSECDTLDSVWPDVFPTRPSVDEKKIGSYWQLGPLLPVARFWMEANVKWLEHARQIPYTDL